MQKPWGRGFSCGRPSMHLQAWHCSDSLCVRGRLECRRILEDLLGRVQSLRENDLGTRRGGRKRQFVSKDCIRSIHLLFTVWHRDQYESRPPLASHRAVITRWIVESPACPGKWRDVLLQQLAVERPTLALSLRRQDFPINERAERQRINREYPCHTGDPVGPGWFQALKR